MEFDPMKQRILQSHIIASGIKDFAGSVARHALFTKEWREHDAKVKADAKNPRIVAREKHAPYPRPRAHALVESAVDESNQANFEIVDDVTPTPEQVLSDKKAKLQADLCQAEQTALSQIWPPAKVRAIQFRRQSILDADAIKAREIYQQRQTLLSKMKSAFVAPATTIEEEVEKIRSPDDTAFLKDIKDRGAKAATIGRKAAQAFSDIDDLTAANVDAWKLPTF
jgi:hypothetical protein